MGIYYNPKISKQNIQLVVDAANPKGLKDLINNKSIDVYGNTNTSLYNGAVAWNFSGEVPSSSAKTFRINNVPNTGISDGDWAMEVWVYPTTTGSENIIHMSSSNSSTGWCLPCIQMRSGKFSGHLWQNGPQYVDSNSFTSNKWHNVVVTWDITNKFRIFVNSELQGTNSSFVNYTASNVDNYIWLGGPIQTGCSGNQGKNFTGGIAYLAFRNSVITEDIIKNNFNALRGRFGI